MTGKEIETMIALATAAKLEGAESLLDTERVRRVCNGIGPAWAPQTVRDILNRFAPPLVVTSWIHDLDYDTGGAEADRIAADDRMYHNGLKVANFLFPWWHYKRYRYRRRALELRAALAIGGEAAFTYINKKKDEDK